MDTLLSNFQCGGQCLFSSLSCTATSTNCLSCCCSHWDCYRKGKKQGLYDRDLILGEQRIKHKTQRVDPHASFCSSNSRKSISTANGNGCSFAYIMKAFRDYQWRTTALIFWKASSIRSIHRLDLYPPDPMLHEFIILALLLTNCWPWASYLTSVTLTQSQFLQLKNRDNNSVALTAFFWGGKWANLSTATTLAHCRHFINVC